MNKIGVAIVFIALCANTQVSAQDSYAEYVRNYVGGLHKFKNQRDSIYSEILKERWETFSKSKGVEPKAKPIPPVPFTVDKDTKPTDFEIKVEPIIAPKPVIIPDTNTVKPNIPPITRPSIKPKPEVVTVEPKPTPKPKPTPTIVKPMPTVVDNKPKKPETKPITINKPTSTSPIAKPTPPVVVDSKPKKPTIEPAETKPVTPTVAVTPTAPIVTPTPIIKPSKPEVMGTGNCRIDFYGTPLRVNVDSSLKFRFRDLNENTISDTWTSLCQYDYKTTVDDCLQLKKELRMNDWMYIQFIDAISKEWIGTANKSEATFFKMFLLLQSGYKVKIANSSGQLVLLFASPNEIYLMSYLDIGDARYYIIDDTNNGGGSLSTYRGDFSASMKQVAMGLSEEANLNDQLQDAERKSKNAEIHSSVNKNLMNFYDKYPHCDYTVYFNAPVTKELQTTVVEPLRKVIAGKSELEAANILLEFVQNGFKYKTDDEQFGYERPFFIDECFYYPYCDCEDRSFLFSMLVRRLLNLDVVLLDYPNHIATAVAFKSDVKGDYVTDKGTKYTVCDPTCINAKVGVTMPMFRTTPAKILKF